MRRVDHEGTRRLTTAIQPHENKLYVQQDSFEFEKLVADQNSALRGVEQTGKGTTRLHLQMSEQDYLELIRDFPLLRTGNTEQRRRLWQRVAKLRPHLVAMEFKPRIHAVTR